MLNADQRDWLRTHTVTRCPPGPMFRVIWKPWSSERISEQERIAGFSSVFIDPDWQEMARHYYSRGGTPIEGHFNSHKMNRKK